jgi:hypothetical protein
MVQKNEFEIKWVQQLLRFSLIQPEGLEWQFNGDLKLQLPILAAERFWPLSVIDGIALVQKIETGLECGRWVSTKVRITVLLLEREKK